MTVEFSYTTVGTSNAICFGLSTSSYIADATNYNWRSGTNIFCSEFGFWLSTSDTSGLYRLLTNGTKSLMSSDVEYPSTSGMTYVFRFVLGDTLEMYYNGEKISLETTDTLSDNTAYYLSFAGAFAGVVTITDFTYVDNSEFGYLQYLSGKTLTLLGDSITKGIGSTTEDGKYTNSYATLLTNYLGMSGTNMGVSGTTYTTDNGRTSIISDVANISSSSEIVVINLGTNDFDIADSYYVEIGEWGNSDTSTLNGALYAMYSALYEKFNGTGTEIYISTMIPTRTDISSTVTKNGYTLQDFAEAIIYAAKYFGFNIINLYNGGIKWSTDDFNDNLHPNDSGHAKIAAYIYECIIKTGRYSYTSK